MGGPAYANGEVPEHLLVKDGEHLFFPGTHSRWVGFRQDVFDETGVWLYITPGPNAYRKMANQKRMRQELGTQAAVPGTSSHGGRWTGQTKGHSGLPTWVSGVVSGAIDVGNWASVPWEVFTRLARKWGFIPDIVVPTEKWHLVDLNPWHYEREGFLMALSDKEQRAIYENIAGNNIPFARLIAQQILDMGIEQAKGGRFKGKATTLRAMLAWNDENIEATRDLVRTIRTDLNYLHQVSPYSLKAILEAARSGVVSLTDEQADAIAGQLSAVAVESLAAALEDDFEAVRARLAQLPEETIAALKKAL